MKRIVLLVGSAAFVAAAAAPATVSDYTNFSAWSDAAGPSTMLTFNDFEPGTIITTQYATFGVAFLDGDDSIHATSAYNEDGLGLLGYWGQFGLLEPITVQFGDLRSALAVTYPGHVNFQLYAGDALVGESSYFIRLFTGTFAGITSTIPFDRVIIQNEAGTASIDSLRFGAAVPAPAAAIPFVLVLVLQQRRRRR